MKAVQYKLGQSLPPRHWYQKRVGWFGKSLLAVLLVSTMGAGATGYVMNRNTVQSFASQSSADESLKKITAPLEATTAENIIDVQFVLDQWEKSHTGETWSVVAQSISGPSFEAYLNKDKQYESTSLQELLLTLPIYSQIPVEHQKTLKVPFGKGTKSLETCVDLMVRLSNDTCTELLAKYIDFKKAEDSLKKAGLNKTSFDSYKSAKTTASDTASFLKFAHGDFVSRPAHDALQKLMREQQYREGIPSACPGCVTSNKSNPTDKTIHDVAIVNYSGGSYVLTVFTRDGSYSDITALAGQIQQKILDTTSN